MGPRDASPGRGTRAGKRRDTDLNALVEAYALAAAQGWEDGTTPLLEISLDEAVGRLRLVPEEIGRVVVCR